MDSIKELLHNPPSEYRAVPFWSWNDKLDPETLRWQVREMKKAGLGGYFMHARGGLQTEYLSEDWMQCIDACIDEGNKIDMNSWCYDENGWPSGFAGGIVSGMGDQYHVRWLECTPYNGTMDEKIIALYHIDECNRATHIMEAEATGKTNVHAVRVMSNPYYVDLMSPEVVKAFLEVTHEEYYKRFGKEFGTGMRGFFTDEPQFARDQVPWSITLPEEFKKRNHYDIYDKLIALFIKCEGYEQFRYEYFALVNDRMSNVFGKMVHDWCDEHNCQLTGHAMLEDNLVNQMNANAGAMTFYKQMHIPGIDWLCRRITDPVPPKQLGSVVAQYGKKFALSEMFALCGWDVTWEELKWMAEWQYVHGVNLMCQHLESYSIRGLRKRDYPPSLFYQQTWWEDYHLFNDYFARLGVLLTSGRPVVDVLVLHPMKSAWIAWDHSLNETICRLERDFIGVTETLVGLHIDHHYGDETLIAEDGSVQSDRFIIGQCSYKTVVMPSMLTLDRNTLTLLNAFLDNGGQVISMGDFPTFCEGKPCAELAELKKRVCFVRDYDNMAELFQPVRQISISDVCGEIQNIHYCQREIDGGMLYYMVNLDQGNSYNATITLPSSGRVRRYRVEEDTYEELAVTKNGTQMSVQLTFEPMQSYLLYVDALTAQAVKPALHTENVTLGDTWQIEQMGHNALTMDYCQYSIDGGQWQGPIHTIQLMNLLLKEQRVCDVALKFTFDAELDLEKNKELYLVVELAKEFDLTVNGRKVEYSDCGWWKDIAFHKVNIKPLVQKGENEVILRRKFYQSPNVYHVLFGENVLESERNKLTYDTELETIYLIGDFSVFSRDGYTYGPRKAVFSNGPFVLRDSIKTLKKGNFAEQGLCFFADTMTLSQTVKIAKQEGVGYCLELGTPNVALVKVSVNGTFVKAVTWAPYQVDITDYVQDGDNTVTLEIYASNRNLLGPHHSIVGESYSVSPLTFTDSFQWSLEMWIHPGQNTWIDRYCFVRFGLE